MNMDAELPGEGPAAPWRTTRIDRCGVAVQRTHRGVSELVLLLPSGEAIVVPLDGHAAETIGKALLAPTVVQP